MLPAGCLWRGALSLSLLGGWPCTSLTVMHDDALPTDVKGRRVGAYFIDAVIGAFLWILILNVPGMSDEASALVGPVIALVLLIFLPGTTGWTLGKLMLGLRVVHRDTYEVAGIGRNLVRFLCFFVDAFPYGPPIVGFVLFLVDKQGRRLGDRAAKTLVIHHSYLGAKPAPAQADATGHAADYGIPADPGQQSAGDADPGDQAGGDADPGGQTSGEADPAGAVDLVREADPVEQSTGDQVAAAADPGDADPGDQPDDDAPGSQAVEQAAEHADEQPGVGSPHWDTDRGAYIQQHPDTGEWLQWDDDAKIWGPISQA